MRKQIKRRCLIACLFIFLLVAIGGAETEPVGRFDRGLNWHATDCHGCALVFRRHESTRH